VLDSVAEDGWNPGLDDDRCFYAADTRGSLSLSLEGNPSAAFLGAPIQVVLKVDVRRDVLWSPFRDRGRRDLGSGRPAEAALNFMSVPLHRCAIGAVKQMSEADGGVSTSVLSTSTPVRTPCWVLDLAQAQARGVASSA
jgi:hypothetical protein